RTRPSGTGPGPRSRLRERAALRDDTPPARRPLAAAALRRAAGGGPGGFARVDRRPRQHDLRLAPRELQAGVRPPVRAGAPALGRLRSGDGRALPPDRLPGRVLHRALWRALEAHADRAGRAAV